MEGWDAVDVLNYFLCGSEDLWGMIDWGNYTAGFHDKLFYKMLEAAKRYGDTETNGYPAIADYRYYFTFYSYENKEKLEEEGMVSVGYLFDDGCYEQVILQSLAINKNSGCKEGAWELIAFLLGEKAQETLSVKKSELYFPVNKKVYEVLKEDAVKNGKEEDGSVVSIWGEITTADAEELTAEIEDARVLPIRTKPILDIVYEEAQEYFAGVKTAEDVAEVIENRVQLFLDEIKN